MGIYRARDLVTVPSLLSLARLPLAALFPVCSPSPGLAVGVLALAGVTDVLDGWYARRFDRATATGAVVDGLTDKIFVLTVVVTLLVQNRLSVVDLLLLSTREIGEMPLVVWWALSPSERRRKSRAPMANVPGKLATTLQFGAVALITANRPATALIVAAALAGIGAALVYWVRELSASRLAEHNR